jgi:hypothetical protein
MAIAVWTLYAADRLMDARLLSSQISHADELEPRHYFHYNHRGAFLRAILCASIALAVLLPHAPAPAIHLYLVLGGLLFGYFILIHATPSTSTREKVAHRLPKEIAVGIFFAAAIFIPTVSREPALRVALLPGALLFATLCSLNCLFIYAWEHAPERSTMHPAHATTRLALRHLQSIAISLILVSIAIALFDHRSPWAISAAVAAAATLLLVLHHRRHAIPSTTLRAAADLALLTPLLFLFFLRH